MGSSVSDVVTNRPIHIILAMAARQTVVRTAVILAIVITVRRI